MQSTQRSHLAATIAALAASSAMFGAAHAGTSTAVDSSGAIQNYDVLGVKLGMTEAQALAAIKERFPAGTKDSRGRAITLKVTDYTLQSKTTGKPVKAGVRVDFYPDQKTNYDFVKVLFNNGKVWAVWRDDTTSTYAYEKTISDMGGKYAGAVPIEDYYDSLVNGQRRGNGQKARNGFELYQGTCSDNTLPFRRVNQGDGINLQSSCNKVFQVKYGVLETGGVKSLGNGYAQLVDLDAGRNFMQSLNTSGPIPTGGARL
ncbi:hypothetical protein [Roseateles sp.]|uniref:hypothetical protein n=1 Tax=Roseateles sp. TaxID=1971397 RepID=UPI003BAAA37C